MGATVAGPLRVLIADQELERLERAAAIVRAAGHEVVDCLVSIAHAGEAVAREQPDVAIVAVGPSDGHALELVAEIVEEAACPVVIALEKPDPEFVAEAAEAGAFAAVTQADSADLQSAFEIVLRRFEEYRRLEQAFARRALVERAKGILMERHGLDEREAFELLRARARSLGIRLVAAAQAVVTVHPLLPSGTAADGAGSGAETPPPLSAPRASREG